MFLGTLCILTGVPLALAYWNWGFGAAYRESGSWYLRDRIDRTFLIWVGVAVTGVVMASFGAMIRA